MKPPRVREGDTVAVVTPAGPADPARAKRGIECLASRYDLHVPATVFDKDGFLAGGDEARAEELNKALRDPDVRAVVLVRGGYGITRILPLLDEAALREDPKLLVGFSDATALLAWALVAAGVRGIHGPMAAQLGELGPECQQWLFRMMEDPAPQGAWPHALTAVGAATGEGPLLGGNLSLLSHLLGTPHALSFRDAVLFFEDIGERPYAVDRYLTHLHGAGVLDGCRGVVVGHMTRCEESSMPDSPDVAAVIEERMRAFELSGVRGAHFGHEAPHFAIPFGGLCALGGDRLTLLDGAVA